MAAPEEAAPEEAARSARARNRTWLVATAVAGTVCAVLFVATATLALVYALAWLRRAGAPGLSGEFAPDHFWAQQNNLGALVVGGFSATIGAIVAVIGTWLVAWFVGDRIQKASHQGATELQAQMIKFQEKQAKAQREHEELLEERQRVFDQRQQDSLVRSRRLEATASDLDSAITKTFSAVDETYTQSIYSEWGHISENRPNPPNEPMETLEGAFEGSEEALYQLSIVLPLGDYRSMIDEVIKSLAKSRETLRPAFWVSFWASIRRADNNGELEQHRNDLLIASGRLIRWLADGFRLKVLDVVSFHTAVEELTDAEATRSTELLEECAKLRDEMWRIPAFQERAEAWGLSP